MGREDETGRESATGKSSETLPIHPLEPRNRRLYAAACAALNRALRDFEQRGSYGTVAVEIPVAGGVAQVCDLVCTDRLRCTDDRSAAAMRRSA